PPCAVALSLHDALPISAVEDVPDHVARCVSAEDCFVAVVVVLALDLVVRARGLYLTYVSRVGERLVLACCGRLSTGPAGPVLGLDRKSTRLNSSHVSIS